MPRSSKKPGAAKVVKKPLTASTSKATTAAGGGGRGSAPASSREGSVLDNAQSSAVASPASTSSSATKRPLGETRKQKRRRKAEEAEVEAIAAAAAQDEEKSVGEQMDSNKYKKQRKNGAGDEAVNGDSRSLVDQMSSDPESSLQAAPIAAGSSTQAAELDQDFVRFEDDDDDDESSPESDEASKTRQNERSSVKKEGKRPARAATTSSPADAPMSECPHCEDYGHEADSCPLFWRRYSYLSPEQRDAEMSRRETLVQAGGWQQQAFGAVYKLGGGAWCYECAAQGHYGDDCPQRSRRMSSSKASTSDLMTTPSAFSASIGLSSPFASSYPPGWEPSSIYHSRDGEDALPFAESQPEFNVGAKGKQKAQRALAAANEAEEEKEEEDGEEDWFNDRQRKRKQLPPPTQRQAQGQGPGTPVGNKLKVNGGGGTGAFKPFSPTVRLHQSSAGGLSAGRGNSSSRNNDGGNSNRNNGRMGGRGGGSSGFYGSGQGGGNVSNWGRDFDRYERQTQQQQQQGAGGGSRDASARYGGGGATQHNRPTYRGGY